MKELLEYIKFLAEKHRAIRTALLEEGKSYRSRQVSYENGFNTALGYIIDAIEEPERARELHKVLDKLSASFRS